MSHPLFYRGITFFYPIGNTSAVRLTEHLPPEQPADILLLACGDPRHILYTVYTNERDDGESEHQKLDVTCCDIEAAVLARNALLFALLAEDGAPQRLDLIWNIFYHFMLDQDSLFLLIEQCQKLLTLAKNLESWKAGPYAHFLSVCNEDTLAELCRFWSLWVATVEYNAERGKRFRKSFVDGMKDVKDKFASDFVVTSSRSAGPLLHLAPKVVAEQFRKFWSTGVTDDGLHSVDQATLVNPTFAFSMAGEKFAVHYGVDPVAGFHLAQVFASSSNRGQSDAVLGQKIVQAARSQFSQWCTAVIKLLKRSSATASKLVIRMFVGDALMICQAFSHVNSCGAVATPIPVSPWKSTKIVFEDQYVPNTPTPAPTTFNVIHTSNISDHVGVLNLLLVTAPILSKSPSATLYTEALLSSGDTPSTGILEQLCGDLQTISLLLGIVPSAFLSQFTTRSNAHESLLQVLNPSAPQYYHQITWKAVASEYPLSFTPNQLAQVLFAIYLKMFSDENLARQMQTMSISPTRAAQEATLIHYTRHSFVQLLSHVKSRVRADWIRVMEKFDDELARDSSLILGSNFYQEMCCHFHLANIVTFSSMEQWYIDELRTKTKSAIFKDWETIPPVVTVVLVVPRHKITAVEYDLRKAGTPILLCEIRNTSLWNMFAHISAAYGKLETTGTGQTKTATLIPNQEGESESSPLIVFFSVPSSSLMLSSNAMVGIRTRPTPRMSRTSVEAIFTTRLEDSRQVHILAEPPCPPNTQPTTKHSSTETTPESDNAFGVEMDASCTKIRSFTLRVDVTDPAGQASLAAGSLVKIEQTSAHGTRLHIDGYSKKLCFPLPVDATNAKLRVVRESFCVEITVPLALSMDIHSERRIVNRFITTLEGGIPTYWNIHRVNVDRCPLIKPSEHPEAFKWLTPHVSFMFSDRERAMRDKKPPTKDTLMNLKDSLHFLILSAAGVQGGQARTVFALQDMSTQKFLAFIFVSDLRLDIGSHTVVADAWVTPGTTTIQDHLEELGVSNVVAIKLDSDESEAWRYLLPVLIDRCRTWTHRPSCEYLSHDSIPLYRDASTDPEKCAFCSCGVGVDTKTFPQQFKIIAPHATRVAISPLFPVSYLERHGVPSTSTPTPTSNTVADPVRCKACGKQTSSQRVCGKCKGARYCSRECQLKHWKVHKKECK